MYINTQKKGIEVGDLILYENSLICLVIFEEDEFKYGYKLLNLRDCKVIKYYISLEELNKQKNIQLYVKGDKVVLRDK